MSATGTTSATSPNPWVAATPPFFVFLWSTGFIGARLVMPDSEPATFLALRFGLAALLLLPFALIGRAAWPRRWQDIGHQAVAGILIQGIYLCGVFAAIDRGVEAGASALIVSIQPLVVAALAAPLLGEKVSARQWLGLCLGLAGVTLVVWQKLALGLGTPFAMGLCVVSLLAISGGTLYQKRFCGSADLRSANVIQYLAATAAMAALALAFETGEINWSPEFVVGTLWLVLVLSLGAVTLLYQLIRRGAASRVSSLFFLVPPSTAVIAWALFGETFGPLALGGMALTVLGVALVNLPGRRTAT